jgi:hypothetical protein
MQLAIEERDALDADAPRSDGIAALADLVALRDRLCARHGVDVGALVAGGRGQAESRVRREIAFAATARLGLAAQQVARLLGTSRQGARLAAVAARREKDAARVE